MRRRPPDGRGGSRARAAPVAPPRFHDSGGMRDGPVPALVRRRRGTCLPDRPAALADPRGPGGPQRLDVGRPDRRRFGPGRGAARHARAVRRPRAPLRDRPGPPARARRRWWGRRAVRRRRLPRRRRTRGAARARRRARALPAAARLGRPRRLRAFARLAPGAVVISTGCDTRRTRAGGGVLRGRRGRLRRAVRAPFGYASAFAPLLLFY